MLVFALWVFSPILLPFIAGLVLAYFLDPVADALQRLGLSRLAAALLIVIALDPRCWSLALVILAPMRRRTSSAASPATCRASSSR